MAKSKALSEIMIDKGIAIPPPRIGGLGRPAKYPWRMMQIGDSFFVKNLDKRSISSMASLHGRMLGMKFSCRQEGDGMRVWRVE